MSALKGRAPRPPLPRLSPRARRFLLGFGGLVVALWVVVRVVLVVAPPTREAWSVIGVGLDTDVFFARLGVADTGFYADQLTTRVFLLRQEGDTLGHRAMYGPTTLGPDGVESGPDRLARDGDRWTLRVGGDGLQVSARVTGATPGCPPEPGELMGSLGASPVGTTEGFDGGAILEGPAVVVRTRSEGVERGSALYVLGPNVLVAVDPLAECPAWAIVDGRRWSGPALPMEEREQGVVTVGPYQVRWKATAASGVADGFGHLSPPERLLSVVAGWPAPTLKLVRVSARVTGEGFDGARTGVLLVRGWSL